MKMIFCPQCNDSYKVNKTYKSCSCGSTAVEMDDYGKIVIEGPGMPYEIDEESFSSAKLSQVKRDKDLSSGNTTYCKGYEFESKFLPICNINIIRNEQHS